MAQFLGVHKLQEGMSEGDVRAGYTNYKESAVKMGLKPVHAHLSMEKGFAYCVTEAPSAEDVRRAHADVAIPLEDVIEIETIE